MENDPEKSKDLYDIFGDFPPNVLRFAQGLLLLKELSPKPTKESQNDSLGLLKPRERADTSRKTTTFRMPPPSTPPLYGPIGLRGMMEQFDDFTFSLVICGILTPPQLFSTLILINLFSNLFLRHQGIGQNVPLPISF